MLSNPNETVREGEAGYPQLPVFFANCRITDSSPPSDSIDRLANLNVRSTSGGSGFKVAQRSDRK
jgi:hypothetical protein